MGNRMRQIKFVDLLDNLDAYSWRDELFVTSSNEIEIDTICYVLSPDEISNYEDSGAITVQDEPVLIKEFLSIHDIRLVLKNLEFYQPNASKQEVLSALKHYYEHDAYGPHSA